ncbi:hypothetical protein NGM10_04385 [Halorussus salilacus]|uniref:hypothetical protein n=1 Tax=Halorussus salilacus TaxID=2953750 RepID=UPI0020A0500B|nr:hypothetical protein [Halorussus salilacus]USZ68979.1 hypothetical protein NGM10_04385 [Halorussus salilacus]
MADDAEPADIDWDEAVRMELDPDTMHETKSGYYFDCPECGSPATIENIVQHGRCNGYLDEQVEGIDFEVENISCSAVLRLELAYTAESESER